MYLKKGFLIAFLFLILISCSDDPASDSENEAPTLPSFEVIQPDLSYFINNNPQKAKQTTNNFNTAKSIALTLNGFTAYGQIYAGFFQVAGQSDAELKNGSWVWDYSYSYDGESISVELTSRESGNNILWDMTWSYQGSEEGFDDYTVIEGSTSKDGKSGTWTFNTLDPSNSNEVPFLVSEWQMVSDTQINITTNFYEDGQPLASLGYSQNGSVFNMTMSDFVDQNESLINWNTDTKEGYYEIDSERKCWDSNFQDTDC